MDLKGARIGYVPYSPALDKPGDKRRFCYYAQKRNIKFEIADPSKDYDLVVLTERADLSIWSTYRQGQAKIVYDLIDSYLAIPRHDIKGIFRGAAKFIVGQSRTLQPDYWKAIERMCRRADAVVCSTEEQRKDILKFCTQVHRILDFHSSVVRHVKQDYAASDVFKLVWEGLPCNLEAFHEIADVLKTLASKRKIELHLVTDLEYFKYLGSFGRQRTEVLARQFLDHVHLHAWDEKTCAEIITSCDLALIPVPLDDPFAMGKPENKLLLLWRMGMPVVVSAAPAYARAMRSCGLPMACRSKEEWATTLMTYMDDADIRRAAGGSGRCFAEEQYGEGEILKCWDQVFDTIGIDRDKKQNNIDVDVVSDFGSEWSRFDQSSLSTHDQAEIFKGYFHIFPWDSLPLGSTGADIGCGSGRWASMVAGRVGHLHLVDPSGEALAVARRNLKDLANVSFSQASVDDLSIEEESLDFAYSLGVLHHVPDTKSAIRSIARVLKPGAPFLIYLYYAFDNRPWWFRAIWMFSDALRNLISRMPTRVKNFICDVIALFIYLPSARIAQLLDHFGILPDSWPLAYYRHRAYYVMRTDALDRFGTRLEKRFNRQEITLMLQSAGFTDIRFSDIQPFWCAVGTKQA